MPRDTPLRFSFPLARLRARPLDDEGRRRIEALLYAGRETAAVNAYREAARASYPAAVRAVRRLQTALGTPA